MLDVRLYYPNHTWDDIKLRFVPRAGEAVTFRTKGRMAKQWIVSEVEWFIDQTGEQSAVLSLADSK